MQGAPGSRSLSWAKIGIFHLDQLGRSNNALHLRGQHHNGVAPVTTSKAPVTTSVALVSNSFLLLLVRHLLLLAWHLLLLEIRRCVYVEFGTFTAGRFHPAEEAALRLKLNGVIPDLVSLASSVSRPSSFLHCTVLQWGKCTCKRNQRSAGTSVFCTSMGSTSNMMVWCSFEFRLAPPPVRVQRERVFHQT